MKQLSINGQRYEVDVPDDEMLLWVLRDDLGLTGTKPGCDDVGVCGCCMVLVDGQPVLSCKTTVAEVAGQAITTIEGLATTNNDGTIHLHPVQQVFLDAQASQCGWCLGGQVLSTVALLNSKTNPSKADIDEAMDRVYCRCAIYGRIRTAIERSVEQTVNDTTEGA